MKKKIKVADFVINFFAEKGVDKIFVVYGAANGDLIDAFTKTKKTKYIAVLHEQAGGFAAEGFAKVKENKIPGVAIATSGPGGMNFITSIGNCFYDSVPVIFITGQVRKSVLRKNSKLRQVGFQETDISGISSPITKYSKLILDPYSIKYELEKSLHLATSGRPGPVLLDIPIDVQNKTVEINKLKSFNSKYYEINFSIKKILKKINLFLDDLEKFNRPALIIGGGVRSSGAINNLNKLSKLLKIPIFPTWNALDIVTSDQKYYGGRIGTYGGAGRNFGIQNCNLLLSIGSRMSGRLVGGNSKYFAREATKYLVDIDKYLLRKDLQELKFDQCIHSDAKLFINLLLKEAKKRKNSIYNQDKKNWHLLCQKWKKKYDPVKNSFFQNKNYVHPYAFIRVLSKKMKNKDILVGDCGGNIVTLNHAFETKKGQRFFTNNGNSPMGFSFSAAIGAYYANPKKNVVCVIGDGGMNMNIQELQTIYHYNVKVKTIILNNYVLGITKAYQKDHFGKSEACGPEGYSPPDFNKVADAYNIKVLSVSKNSEIADKIDELINFDGPIIMNVNCNEFYNYEPRVFGWNKPIEEMYPYLNREEFRKNMITKPLKNWKKYIPGKK